VVSPDSVAQIPALASSLGESSIEKYLPAPLISIRLLGTALWIWIALVLLGLLLAAVSRLLSRLTLALLRPLTSKFTGALHAHRIEEFTEPLRLLLTVVIFRACMGVITPSALLRERINYVLLLLFVLGCAALTMRIVDVLADKVISRLDPRQRSLSYSVIPLTARFLKICVFCIAAILLLQNWGVNVTTILAGVGVGGLAVALAAQKTLENLFGGISVLTDRPVLVGDFCQFGGQVGTVEDIGLRSTRIRTLDRTVVTIPNSTFSAMTLENYARRDRIWFHPTLHLRRDSSADQIRAMMTMLEEILRRHPKVDAGGYPVRFVKIDAQSYDLEIFAYLLTPDFDEFLKFQSEILLEFVEAGAHVGISFAVPLQESVVALHDFAERESQRSGEAGRHDAVELESLK
jgi:MscS family membrane protein